MTDITIAILLIDAVLIFALPRRYVLIPIVASGIVLPMSERIFIFTLDFTAIRLLLICGWLRLIIKGEYHPAIKINNIDKVLILYVLWITLSYTILWQTMEALIYKLGGAYYFFGTYLLVRFYITELDDIERIVKTLLYLSVAISIIAIVERTTHNNLFSVLGGVSNETIIRDGQLRCFGPFAHPITLGSFGAFLFPLACYMLWGKKGGKKLGLISLISSVIIVYSSSSSGPALSLIAAIMGLFMWHLRKHMRMVMWGMIFCVIGLHFIMKAPVWALINRISVFSGSSHYHRFLLVDQAINRFSEWWLIGTRSTAHWSEYIQTWDISNNYVRVGVDGGILALILFIVIIMLCFRYIGKMMNHAKDNLSRQRLFWALGVAMFSYVVSFLGVSLWDQTIMIWYLIIAMIASITFDNSRMLQKKKS